MSPYDPIPEPMTSTHSTSGTVTPAANTTSHASGNVDDGRKRALRRVTWSVAGLAGFLIAFGTVQHVRQNDAAVTTMKQRQHAVPKVHIEPVKATFAPRDLSLPGSTAAFESATIYARQSGYVAKRVVDIGSKVHAGDLLAVITAPEIDDQLTQARAQLDQMKAALRQAEANRNLAQTTSRRTAALVSEGWASRQQGDTDAANLQTQTAAVGAAQANVAAQQAQVAKLEKQQSYERVVAPFDGVITQRSIDTGSLVTADSTSGSPMFALAHTDQLRVQVYVPQDAAPGIRQGVPASIVVPEMPGRVFNGTVARTAESLQAGTRTLLAEVDVANPDGALAAGVYCTVKFQVPRADPVIVIPAEALIIDKDGPQVAAYDHGKARLRKVQLGEDDGDHISIAAGLTAGDQVIVSLPVDLQDGAPVAPRDVQTAGISAHPGS